MKDFNVGNPTKENIDFAFKNLIYYINASIELEEYKEYKEQFKKVLLKINNILSIYVNKEDICLIENELLQDIKYDLIDLKVISENLNSFYAEWALQWLEAIMSLKVVKEKEEK